MEGKEKGEKGKKSSPLNFDALLEDDQNTKEAAEFSLLNIPVPTPAPFDPNLIDFGGNGIDAINKNGDITGSQLGSKEETKAEDAPFIVREEEKNVPYSSLFDPGASTSWGKDISAHQQTTSGAEDISAYQQTASGAEDISAYQQTTSGAGGISAYQQTTSGAEDISAYQQTASGAEGISAYQQTTSGAEDISAYQQTASGAEGISAYQQTTSGAEDISAYQQTTPGAEDISAHQDKTSGAEDVQYPLQKIKTAHCGACGEMLEDTEEELSNHNCSEAKCEFCDTPVIFKDYSDFVQHSESAHKDKYTFHCPYCIMELCPFIQIDNLTLKNHERYTDELNRTELCGKGNYFKCYECNDGTIVFKVYKDFEVHKILYHLHHRQLPKRQCAVCQEIFPTSQILMDHGAKKHGTRNVLQCPYCGLCFHQGQVLPPHLRKHREEREQQIKEGHQLKTHPCPHCTKDFASELFLRNHAKKVHNKEISYPCAECKETFPYTVNVEEHKQKKHPSPGSQKSQRKRHDTDKDKDEGFKVPKPSVG